MTLLGVQGGQKLNEVSVFLKNYFQVVIVRPQKGAVFHLWDGAGSDGLFCSLTESSHIRFLA